MAERGFTLTLSFQATCSLREPDWSDTNEIRSSLLQYAQEHGAKALHRRLCDVDPEAAASIHPNNIRRVARALEIYLTTGVTKTSWDARSRTGENALPALVIGLRFADRNLHRRIIMKRCEKMFDTGLVDEVRRLYEAGKLATGTASQAIGYKEIIPYILGQSSHKEALASLYTDHMPIRKTPGNVVSPARLRTLD